MACHRLELAHAARAEPLPETVDEGCACAPHCRGREVEASSVCFGSMRSATRDGEAQRLETEAGIDRFDDALELEIDETRDMRRSCASAP